MGLFFFLSVTAFSAIIPNSVDNSITPSKVEDGFASQTTDSNISAAKESAADGATAATQWNATELANAASLAKFVSTIKFEDISEDYSFGEQSINGSLSMASSGKNAQAIEASAEVGGCSPPGFSQAAGSPDSLLVWSYFDSDAKPEPISFFQETWKKNIGVPEENFHHVTPANLRYYLNACDLPSNYASLEPKSAKSDIIRVALIARYGGVYLDVSTIVYPNQGHGILSMWRQITSGGRSAAVCHDSGMPHKYDYVEDYFLMAQRGNTVFAQWHQKQLEVVASRTQMSGVVNDNGGFYTNRDFKYQDALDYFALSNFMVMNLASRDRGVADEISNKWILLDWNQCLENHFRLKNAGKNLVTPLDDGELRDMNQRGVNAFDKFTSFHALATSFTEKYSQTPDRGNVLNDRTALSTLMHKAGVSYL